MNIKKTARLGLLTAIALTIFMVEAQLPALVPIPGVKLGLANIVTVFTVFTMGPGAGAAVPCEGGRVVRRRSSSFSMLRAGKRTGLP